MATIDNSGPGAWTAAVATLDAYSALSHKAPLDPTAAVSAGLAPTWVPRDERRRLIAYTILKAYLANVSRVFLRGASRPAIDARREYGDPAVLVARIVAGVLGDTISVDVGSAANPPPDEPNLPPEPEDGDGTELARRIATARRARWEAATLTAVEAWEQAWADYPGAIALQQTLRRWANDEQLAARLHEQEADSVGLGDGVILLHWSAGAERPRIEVCDPGFYFPVLNDSDEFPTKAHVAWELEVSGERFVRRRTWELVTLDTPRHYRYLAPGETSPLACVFSDGTWPLRAVGANGYANLAEDAATWAVTDDGSVAHQLDLGIDFLPIVHIPNTPTGAAHFGESSIAPVAQIFDDIQGNDSDAQLAAKFCAGPTIGMAGASAGDNPIPTQPGVIYGLGEHGRMDVLDLSAGLAQLTDLGDRLLERLSVNARVPAEALGRTGQAQAVSGLLVQLRLGPFAQHIRSLRLTRTPKHALLLKMVTRLYQVHGHLDDGRLPAARITLGSFLPSDRAELVATVATLLDAGAISPDTAVNLLIDGGVPIRDAATEVARIRAADPAGARDATDATGSPQVGADWLGVEIPDPIGPPTVSLPPA